MQSLLILVANVAAIEAWACHCLPMSCHLVDFKLIRVHEFAAAAVEWRER